MSVPRDLILFATRRRSFVTSLSLHDDDRRASLKVIEQPYPRPGARHEREVYAVALNLCEHSSPQQLWPAWWDLRRRIGPVWNTFFAAFDRSESLLDDRLLGLLSFAEGYHRAMHNEPPLTRKQQKAAEKAIKSALDDRGVRSVYRNALAHANSQTQSDRVAFFVDRALWILGDWWYVEHDVLVGRLVQTRNWLVHWNKHGQHVIDDTPGLVELVRGLILVLYTNLLLDLGLDDEQAASVIGSGWRREGPPLAVFGDDEDS